MERKPLMNTKRWIRIFAIGLTVLILLLIFKMKAIEFLFLIALVAIGAFSTLYRIPLRSPINFEAILLCTAFAGYKFGVISALFVGLGATLLSRLITGHVDERMLIYSIGILQFSFLTPIITPQNHFLTFMGLVLVFNIIVGAIIQFLGGRFLQGIAFVGSNVVFNFFLILIFGKFIFV